MAPVMVTGAVEPATLLFNPSCYLAVAGKKIHAFSGKV